MHKYLILDESGKPLFRAVMRQAMNGGVCRAELENEEDVEKLVPGGLFQLMGIRDGNFAEVRFLRGRGETAEFEMVRMLDSGTRQNLRIPVRFESFLYPVSGAWKGRAAIVSRDLSCGGIAFVSEKALQVGISQISGASRTSVGGYTEEERPHDSEQFDVSDQRTLDEVVHWLMELGFLPSFCTACYREGRTGDRFMSLCKNGQIQNCCHPNALMTLTEFLTDYASEETKQTGFALIEKELQKIPNEKVRAIATENVEAIRASNRRDFRF